MQAKQAVLEILDRLPDDCTLDDVLYHVYVARSIDRGEEDVRNGRVLSQAEVAERLRRPWLSDRDG